MSGLFAGTSLEQPVTCEICRKPLDDCTCPRDAEGSVLRPCDQIARIRIEKRKGRPVTVVSGLDSTATDLAAIARSLRSTCSAGGTVTSDGFELQGNHRSAVADRLRHDGFQVRGATA